MLAIESTRTGRFGKPIGLGMYRLGEVSGAEHPVDGRTLRYQHRRPELLAAAVEYILERGIAELSLRPMAKELGVTHATLLRHFGTKEALVLEVVKSIREDLLDQLVRSSGHRAPDSPGRSMWAAWRQLCEPSERRQFVLLFELGPGRVGVARGRDAHGRTPARHGRDRRADRRVVGVLGDRHCAALLLRSEEPVGLVLRSADDRFVALHDDRSLHQLFVLQQDVDHRLRLTDERRRIETELLELRVLAHEVFDRILEHSDDLLERRLVGRRLEVLDDLGVDSQLLGDRQGVVGRASIGVVVDRHLGHEDVTFVVRVD